MLTWPDAGIAETDCIPAFEAFAGAVGIMMKTEPNCSAQELAAINVPVAIVQAEHDEFIKPEHAEYLARTIPGAEPIALSGVSHFAPLQRPRSSIAQCWRTSARFSQPDRVGFPVLTVYPELLSIAFPRENFRQHDAFSMGNS